MSFDKRNTEVYKYLLSLQTYAYGDLNLFHKLCKEAEDKESQEKQGGQTEITSSGAPEVTTTVPVTNSSSTTYTTTLSEGSLYAPPHPSPKFRATIPFAMMILSCIEILGYLTKEDGNERQTLENIRYFLENTDGIDVEDDDIKLLVLIFRHGLAHAYFPKLNYGISYRSTNPNTLFYRNASSMGEILNVKYLETCFRLGLEKIVNDSSIYPLMERQYLRLIDLYTNANHELIQSREL